MKPLIVSFFLVILAYSLFLDKREVEENIPSTTNNQTIRMNATDSVVNSDSTILFAQDILNPLTYTI